jgi:hypothetical protein
MKRIRKWWNGEVFTDESPYVVYIGFRKPWLRTVYDKHAKSIWASAGAVALLIISKLLDKLL